MKLFLDKKENQFTNTWTCSMDLQYVFLLTKTSLSQLQSLIRRITLEDSNLYSITSAQDQKKNIL